MADYLRDQTDAPIQDQLNDPIQASTAPLVLNNYQFISVGAGMSTSEKIR
jgi:hypothetical protein